MVYGEFFYRLLGLVSDIIEFKKLKTVIILLFEVFFKKWGNPRGIEDSSRNKYIRKSTDRSIRRNNGKKNIKYILFKFCIYQLIRFFFICWYRFCREYAFDLHVGRLWEYSYKHIEKHFCTKRKCFKIMNLTIFLKNNRGMIVTDIQVCIGS